jgi:hypothetical protein
VVSSQVYRAIPNRVVSGRVFVLYYAVFRVVSCRVRTLNHVVPYSRKIEHGTAHVMCRVLTMSCLYRVVSFVPCSATVTQF